MEDNYYNISFYFGDEIDKELKILKLALLEIYLLEDVRPVKLSLHQTVHFDIYNEDKGIKGNLALMNLEELGENYMNIKKAAKEKEAGEEISDEEIDDIFPEDFDEGVEHMKNVGINEMKYYSHYSKQKDSVFGFRKKKRNGDVSFF